jgi:glycerophosphoryl diester phosphodiesterase
VVVVAHRGLTNAAPENSLASVGAALRERLEFIEVDVRSSLDGALFLLHDATLERTTDQAGRLADLTIRQAERVHLEDGSTLPRLEHALAMCVSRATLCLDVKDTRAVAALLPSLRASDGGIEVWSEHESVIAAGAEAGVPSVLICNGLLPKGIGDFLWRARELGAAGVSFYPADIEPHVAAACRNAAMPFLCGTPNDEGTWRFLTEAGARAIITDRPLHCLAWLNSRRRVAL